MGQWSPTVCRTSGSLRICRTSIQALLPSIVSIGKLGVILMALPLQVTWAFSLTAFHILVLYFQCFDYYVSQGIYFWSFLFALLYAFCTLIDTFCFRLGNFSSTILLKIFFILVALVSSHSSAPDIHFSQCPRLDVLCLHFFFFFQIQNKKFFPPCLTICQSSLPLRFCFTS